jgi:uncharacterized protein
MPHYLTVLVLIILLAVEWGVALFGLPGNWFMVVTFAGFAGWLLPPHDPMWVTWAYVAACAVIALVGEIAEVAASAAGVAKGGSKRGAFMAMVGAIIGAVIGAFIGVPIPVIGSLIGVIVMSCVGAMVGAFAGEMWKGRTMGHSAAIGKAAFIGRFLGSIAKIACGTIIFAVASLAAALL